MPCINIFSENSNILEKKYQEALNYYQQGLKNKNKECMYMYAKMLFLGEGKKDTYCACEYFNK